MIDVTRSVEAPSSLREQRRYDGQDVREALWALFLEKCYLCETPVERGTLQIDHRRPHGDAQQPGLEFDWANLFPTCSPYGCNQRRKRSYPEGGLLDPSAGDGVERRVSQALNIRSGTLRRPGDTEIAFGASDPNDRAATNTADELDRIHNGTGSTPNGAAKAHDLRVAITNHALSVCHDVFALHQLDADPGADLQSREDLRRKVRALVSRRAPYSMLVRSLFAKAPSIAALFDEQPVERAL